MRDLWRGDAMASCWGDAIDQIGLEEVGWWGVPLATVGEGSFCLVDRESNEVEDWGMCLVVQRYLIDVELCKIIE